MLQILFEFAELKNFAAKHVSALARKTGEPLICTLPYGLSFSNKKNSEVLKTKSGTKFDYRVKKNEITSLERI